MFRLQLRAHMALTSGTKLGPHEIQSALGAGGMGEVYRAQDTRSDAGLGGQNGGSEPKRQELFRRGIERRQGGPVGETGPSPPENRKD